MTYHTTSNLVSAYRIANLLQLYLTGEISSAIESDSKTQSVIELTDGWYRIFATVDKVLQRAVTKGKVKIGSKLSICGAQVKKWEREPTRFFTSNYNHFC